MAPTAGVDDRPTCPHTPLMNLTRREPCDGLDRQAEEQEGRNGRRSQGTAWQGDRRRRVGARRQDRPDQEQPQAGWRESQGRLQQGLSVGPCCLYADSAASRRDRRSSITMAPIFANRTGNQFKLSPRAAANGT